MLENLELRCLNFQLLISWVKSNYTFIENLRNKKQNLMFYYVYIKALDNEYSKQSYKLIENNKKSYYKSVVSWVKSNYSFFVLLLGIYVKKNSILMFDYVYIEALHMFKNE